MPSRSRLEHRPEAVLAAFWTYWPLPQSVQSCAQFSSSFETQARPQSGRGHLLTSLHLLAGAGGNQLRSALRMRIDLHNRRHRLGACVGHERTVSVLDSSQLLEMLRFASQHMLRVRRSASALLDAGAARLTFTALSYGGHGFVSLQPNHYGVGSRHSSARRTWSSAVRSTKTGDASG